MQLRRTLLPLVLLTATTLAACGGGDDSDSGAARDDSSPSASSGPSDGNQVGVSACDLLTTDEVAAAVGSPVKEGIEQSGQPITGGTFTSCQWMSDDPDNPADAASLYLYTNTAAADSAREDDSQVLEGIGDQAFSVAFAGVWVYEGEQSFLAQWYTFSGTDEENLPTSEALARAAVEKLSA
ncbi:DUF3558 family protein [Nocardioides anomalus]|uniref:DUF3558 family protein n=1 Tax=Nocardioides anomalus TaxID=2712223 RepID=A0A6G6WFK7_9ACTN|nr:DUF3558 family protein [Nocardioides anomalus]QIG43943.1 DUF3558 family protein [Nocardioides anomalus]